MTQTTLDAGIVHARNCFNAGDFSKAEQICRQILAQVQDCDQAIYLLGLIASRFGVRSEATGLFRRAIECRPNVAEYHDSLGSLYRTLDLIPQAAACFERATQLRPDWDDARCRLSATLMLQSDLVPPQCQVSYVIASRNDTFCGNPMSRLRAVLQRLLDATSDAEIIVADWGSSVPIFDAMKSHLPARGKIRFLHIPAEVTSRFKSTFSEVHALNAAIRNSRGNFVARLDQDTLIGDRFSAWVTHLLEPNDLRAYFSMRRDLPPDALGIQKDAPVWRGYEPDWRGFLIGAVGVLLAPRKVWQWTRGYDERLIFRNHMEHGLCLRFANLVGLKNLGMIVDCDFYHLWHEQALNVVTNPQRPITELMTEAKRNPRANDERWGLAPYQDQIVENVL